MFEHGELPAGELASAAELTPADGDRDARPPRGGGYVERARSDADRRAVVSRLTSEGESLMLRVETSGGGAGSLR
jgi:DNA-binding MarR family transcriptional regulator